MGVKVTFDVSDVLYEQALNEATQKTVSVESVLRLWLERGSDDGPYLFFALHNGYEAATALEQLLKPRSED